MKKETFTAWAIDTRSEEGHSLIGRYWNFGGEYPKIPVSLEGCVVALFETRYLAKKNLPDVKRSFPRAVPVHVQVTIKKK